MVNIYIVILKDMMYNRKDKHFLCLDIKWHRKCLFYFVNNLN